MNTSKEAIAKLQARIAENALEDEFDLLLFIRLASRMKALGDASAFDKIPEIVARPEFAGQLDGILKERCEQGVFDLQEQTGEPLAMSLIATQDFWLFYKYAKNTGLFSQDLNAGFAQWADHSEAADVDEETASLLRDWLQTYPIAEEDCLSVILVPLTSWDYKLMEDVINMAPYHEVSLLWEKESFTNTQRAARRADVLPQVLVLACDDGKPSEELLRQQGQLVCDDPQCNLRVKRSLSNRWVLRLEIQDRGGNPYQPELVCVDRVNAKQDPDDPSLWTIDLSGYPEDLRRFLLEDAVVKIELGKFHGVKVTFPED